MTERTLTEDERRVLGFMSDHEEYGHGFDTIASDTRLDRKRVRAACRSLAADGLAKFCRVLWDPDENIVRGSGYMVTAAGSELGLSLDEMTETAAD